MFCIYVIFVSNIYIFNISTDKKKSMKPAGEELLAVQKHVSQLSSSTLVHWHHLLDPLLCCSDKIYNVKMLYNGQN